MSTMARITSKMIVQSAGSTDELYKSNISNLSPYTLWYDDVAKMYCIRKKAFLGNPDGPIMAFFPDEFEHVFDILIQQRAFESLLDDK